ncbi:NAD(P)H-binding protein [Actinoplanes sp. NPDC023936]|uniref:SDR family oxidoreductase n=1 Tax=Actinoplanes sp. NPDC023936 TaxID=3154910 RepID=UPI0033E12FA6
MKILVTGATGTVGGHIVRKLRGHEVVALVRDPSAAMPAGVTAIAGNLTDRDDVNRALEGVDRAFLILADDSGAVFAEAAAEAGLQLVVMLSSFTVDTPLRSGAANVVAAHHRAGEQALTEAGVPSAFLRAGGFDYNIVPWVAAARDDVVRLPYPDMRSPFVDPADIAASAVALLSAAEPMPGAYSITGPEAGSLREQVAEINRAFGRSYVVQELGEKETGIGFLDEMPDPVRTSFLEVFEGAGQVTPSDDVLRLTGTPARPFSAWLDENRGAFAMHQ